MAIWWICIHNIDFFVWTEQRFGANDRFACLLKRLERREMLVTDGQNDRQHDYSMPP